MSYLRIFATMITVKLDEVRKINLISAVCVSVED